MKVSAQNAEAHFPDLLWAAASGIEVEIAVPDKATLKLVVAHPPGPAKPAGRRILGAVSASSRSQPKRSGMP